MTPLLVLAFGFHPVTAVGTDLLYASATKTVGTAVHGYSGTVDWKVVRRLATGSVPATVAGPENAQDDIVMKPVGMPASAAIIDASRLPPSWPSGDVVHCMIESGGRARRTSSLPATIVAISTAASASGIVTTVSV